MNVLSDDIWVLLKNTSAVTALLDTYSDSSSMSYPAIFPGYEIPGEYEVDNVINFYRTSPRAGGMTYIDETYSINCRAQTEDESLAIAEAVFNAMNRYSSQTSFVCDVLQVIPPLNEADLYNTPVEVRATRGA